MFEAETIEPAQVLEQAAVRAAVMVRPRQPREARSSTAQTRVRQQVSPGSRRHLGAAAGLAEGPPDEVGCRIRFRCSAGNRR